MSDLVLLYLVTILLFLAAFMKLKLAEKKGENLSPFWKVQRFFFPVMLLVVTVLFQVGISDWVIQGVFIGILEEIIFGVVRKLGNTKQEP